MDTLQATLNKLQETLNELDVVLVEEVKQLSGAQINPVSLQRISDMKSRLLSTVAYYDEQRKQQEDSLQLFAPYPQQPTLAAFWNDMVPTIKRASEMNQQTSQLLEMHMQRARNLIRAIDKTAAAPGLYTAGGQSDNNGSTRAYNITI
ncbi:MAG: flagellar export chaperone FlgN [Mixta calida]|mgnify:CR=1 FL=1|jgi:flagella synthesis protein FlgN|uniref:flagella synthesis protein FlgN n=2 Tax=Erwiniaceae TaxID=1903409 RepID=UPI000535AF0D|nr:MULTISPECIES: flagellar export chaperone FlgN [Mixta]AIX75420.1 hypothetical protein PSNIH2_17740 [Pantoea sp. PSNIH2]MBS6059688.1 flagellar export chaperone FlgN [Pantoea sp.]POU46699.1 hypothetical protein C3380_14535 [Pantoea sp. PSNIH5]POU67282.1 hypothetical protein C3374_10330 [Pantoea sp. PSNIH4]POY67564.1 hypothetical protein C3402_11775 [Pantoea sp. PSNIH3]